MNYLEALDRLDALAARMAEDPGMPENWRLHVRERGESHVSQVELQHWEGSGDKRYWYTTANVSVGARYQKAELRLVTSIACTMCGHWPEEAPRGGQRAAQGDCSPQRAVSNLGSPHRRQVLGDSHRRLRLAKDGADSERRGGAATHRVPVSSGRSCPR